MAETVEDLKKQLQELNDKLKEAGGLGIDVAEAFNQAGNSTTKLNKYITEVKKRLEDITDNTDYIYRTFQDITSELSNQNALLSIGKSSFKSLTGIAQDLNFYQKGNTELSEKQLRKIQDKIKLDKSELEYVVKNLQASVDNNKATAENLQSRQIAGEKLSKTQKEFLKNYLKESELLNNTKKTLESGIIPNLERELDISKQISNVRRDIGGLAGNAAKLISAYGGPLASLLNINKASEAIDDFAKKQIEKALKSKDIQEELLKIEKEKARILREEVEEIDKINKNASLTSSEKQVKIAEVEKKTRESINKEEEKASNAKKRAIKNADSLINRFRALGIVIKELGAGLIKAFTDPVSIIGFIIKLFKFIIDAAFEVSTRVTTIGRTLGVSAGLAGRLSGQMIGAAKAAGGIFINSENATEAIGQLADNLGIAVGFTGQQIALQVKLTKLLGLSAEEAAKFNKIAAGSGKSSSQFVTSVQKGAFASMQANKIHLSDKQVLQDVSKLSAGILAKFQSNPEALGAAVVQAKKLGLSLEKLEGISDSLLDFQSSIEAELQAELLTGRQLNLEKARQAALTGNQADLMKEIAEQAGSYKDFTKMNVLAQKSLAQAMGLSREEMAEMLLQQEMVNDHGDKAQELNAQQLKDFQKSGLSLDQYLDKQKNQLSLQEQTNATLERFRETMVNVVAPLGKSLVDAFLKFMPILQKLIDEQLPKIQPFIDDLVKRIDSIDFNQISKDIEDFGKRIEDIKTTLESYKPIIIAIGIGIVSIFAINKVAKFFSFLSTGFSNIKGLVTGIGSGVKSAFSGVKSLFSPASAAAATPTPDLASTTPTPEDTRSPKGRRKKSSFKAPKSTPKISTPDAKGGGGGGFLKGMNMGDMLKGAAAILVLSAALFVAAKAFQEFAEVKWESIAKGGVALAGLAGIALTLGKANSAMIKGAFAIGVLSGALFVAAKALQEFVGVKWEDMAKAGVALIGLGIAGKMIGSMAGSMLKGALAIALLGASLIPAAYALQMFTDISWEDLAKAGVALIGLGVAGAVFGSLLPLMLAGALAIGALGLALIPFAYALQVMAPAMKEFTPLVEAFGNVISKVFNGIATVVESIGKAIKLTFEGIAIAVKSGSDGVVNILKALETVDTEKLQAVGPALFKIGAGLASLGGGNVLEAISSFLAGDPIEKIQKLASTGAQLSAAAAGFTVISTGLTLFKNTISSIDTSKLDAVSLSILKIKDALSALTKGGGLAESIGSFFSSNPLEKLEKLAEMGSKLQVTANAIQRITNPNTPTKTSPPVTTTPVTTEIKSNKESISVTKTNSSTTDKLLTDAIFELKETRRELKAQLNKPPTPIVLTLDGKQVARQLSSYPEMQKGLGKSMVKLS
jgi:hypothetical protein